jgi:hypothetical protein
MPINNLESAKQALRSCLSEIRSPYNDGWTSSACKYELFLLKSWLDDEYNKLPHFADEETWEQQRIIDILKKA